MHKKEDYSLGRVEGTGRKGPRPPPSSHRTCGFPASGVPVHFAAGMHDESATGVSQVVQSEIGEMPVHAHTFRRVIGALAPSFEMFGKACPRVRIDMTHGHPGISVTEVIRPPVKVSIQISDQGRDWFEAHARTCHLTKPFTFPSQGLL